MASAFCFAAARGADGAGPKAWLRTKTYLL